MEGQKVIGVWMDANCAFIIGAPEYAREGEFGVLKKIDREDHEGEKYKNERFELAKEKMELKKYYKLITKEVEGCDDIYIFGPGKTQEELKNSFKEYHTFRKKTVVLGTSNKMSTKMMVARVTEHFGKKEE